MIAFVHTNLFLLCAMLLAAVVAHGIFRFTNLRQDFRRSRASNAADGAPVPIWTEEDGAITWTNAAYETLAATGPPFTEQDGPQQVGAQWFRVRKQGSVHIAFPADAEIREEQDHRQTLQMMTRTFVHLPIGLALFDSNRTLRSFNPALAELTSLTPEFLSRQPTLGAMLDAMRNRRMVPEPRNWKDWRQNVVQMQGIPNGMYEEVWSLPGGQTYRVTGRAQSDGTLALMIEDISTETTRHRRHRAELQLCQSVIDTMEEGVAVFSMSGQVILANAAYVALWKHDPGTVLSAIGITRIADHWRSQSAPSTIWAEAEDYVLTVGPRLPWEAEARLLDGRLVTCRLSPLPDAATIARFRARSAAAPPRAVSTLR